MKTIGEYISHARSVRKKTIKQLSEETKIKQKFIRSIEKEEWHKLPEMPLVTGFVKSIANALEINAENLVVILKRDYPPKKIDPNPKPEIKPEFKWGPKMTFLSGVGIVLLSVIGYLVYQYAGYLRPPRLEIIRPENGQFISSQVVEVSGITEPDVGVVVNTQPAFVDQDGRFYTELEVSSDLNLIEVTAKSRSGKTTTKQVTIILSNE